MLKEQILQLREDGLTYRQIERELGCSKSTIAYYLSKGTKAKVLQRQKDHRKRNRELLKVERGGGCETCGYDRCLGALHFHHRDPNTKMDSIANLITTKGVAAARKESKKCDLVCANCHAELHYQNGSNQVSG